MQVRNFEQAWLILLNRIRRSKTGHDRWYKRSSFTLICNASYDDFSLSFRFPLVQLGNFPLQYHTQSLMRAVREAIRKKNPTVLTRLSLALSSGGTNAHEKPMFHSECFRRGTITISYWKEKKWRGSYFRVLVLKFSFWGFFVFATTNFQVTTNWLL